MKSKGEKRVILLDTENEIAYDLTLASETLGDEWPKMDLIKSIDMIVNRASFNFLQVIATKAREEDFVFDVALDLYLLSKLKAEPDAELYKKYEPVAEPV